MTDAEEATFVDVRRDLIRVAHRVRMELPEVGSSGRMGLSAVLRHLKDAQDALDRMHQAARAQSPRDWSEGEKL